MINQVQPTTAESAEPQSTPSRIAVSCVPGSKAKAPMKSDIVKPMPVTMATP